MNSAAPLKNISISTESFHDGLDLVDEIVSYDEEFVLEVFTETNRRKSMSNILKEADTGAHSFSLSNKAQEDEIESFIKLAETEDNENNEKNAKIINSESDAPNKVESTLDNKSQIMSKLHAQAEKVRRNFPTDNPASKRRRRQRKNEDVITEYTPPSIWTPDQSSSDHDLCDLSLSELSDSESDTQSNFKPMIVNKGAMKGLSSSLLETREAMKSFAFELEQDSLNIQNNGDFTLNSAPHCIVLSKNDVICGRGAITDSLIGNKRYEIIVKLHNKGNDKAMQAWSVMQTVKRSIPHGRFIGYDMKSKRWKIVEDEKAMDFTLQSFSHLSNPSMHIPAPPLSTFLSLNRRCHISPPPPTRHSAIPKAA